MRAVGVVRRGPGPASHIMLKKHPPACPSPIRPRGLLQAIRFHLLFLPVFAPRPIFAQFLPLVLFPLGADRSPAVISAVTPVTCAPPAWPLWALWSGPPSVGPTRPASLVRRESASACPGCPAAPASFELTPHAVRSTQPADKPNLNMLRTQPRWSLAACLQP